ncbi:zinc finger protein 35 [Phyllostomus discolor]|uniref:Zinc finger protein 35 n=1 Tax=Phyllostomus discolor TaxID=89673 RepID=A0A834E306_9CHIR|nr:zinc finger protein 35 [Phyllostomus discolor]
MALAPWGPVTVKKEEEEEEDFLGQASGPQMLSENMQVWPPGEDPRRGLAAAEQEEEGQNMFWDMAVVLKATPEAPAAAAPGSHSLLGHLARSEVLETHGNVASLGKCSPLIQNARRCLCICYGKWLIFAYRQDPRQTQGNFRFTFSSHLLFSRFYIYSHVEVHVPFMYSVFSVGWLVCLQEKLPKVAGLNFCGDFEKMPWGVFCFPRSLCRFYKVLSSCVSCDGVQNPLHGGFGGVSPGSLSRDSGKASMFCVASSGRSLLAE